MDKHNQNNLEKLFKLADKIGKKRYNQLTKKDLDDYRKYNYWRYINGDFKHGTTEESQQWVRDNSDVNCPICERKYYKSGGKTIDHKLPRSQYPWLSLDFNNLWVICSQCNHEKGEMHWYEYEHYLLINHPKRYENIQIFRPQKLLESLKN